MSREGFLTQRLAERSTELYEVKQENERLRTALLHRIMDENGCGLILGERCTGWDAEKCGCAIEAREAVSNS